MKTLYTTRPGVVCICLSGLCIRGWVNQGGYAHVRDRNKESIIYAQAGERRQDANMLTHTDTHTHTHTCISLAAGELSPSRSIALRVILVREADSADPKKISPPTSSCRRRASLLKAEEAAAAPPVAVVNTSVSQPRKKASARACQSEALRCLDSSDARAGFTVGPTRVMQQPSHSPSHPSIPSGSRSNPSGCNDGAHEQNLDIHRDRGSGKPTNLLVRLGS